MLPGYGHNHDDHGRFAPGCVGCLARPAHRARGCGVQISLPLAHRARSITVDGLSVGRYVTAVSVDCTADGVPIVTLTLAPQALVEVEAPDGAALRVDGSAADALRALGWRGPDDVG